MSTDLFEERERSHEAKFKLDQELEFKAQCRGTKLLGKWAAERLGLPQDAAEAYGKRLLGLALGPGGQASVTTQVRSDFAEAGLAIGESAILAAASDALSSAFASLSKEFPHALGPDHVQIGG